MPDTAKRLVGPLILTTASAALYTAPASTVALVRNIHVAGTATGGFYLGIGGTTSNLLLYNNFVVGAQTAFDWSGFLVLAAGEALHGYASGANALSITISGIEVT